MKHKARPRYRQSLGHNHSSQLLSVGTPDTSVSRELVDFIERTVALTDWPGGCRSQDAMTGDEIVALSKKHTITEYAPQDAVNPIPVARAKGVYFWTPEGKRFLDFNSQLMSVNIGHGDPRVIDGDHRAGREGRLRHAVEHHRSAGAPRREAGRDRPGRHRRRSSSPTAAPRPTRTPSRSRAPSPAGQKILARYRSYHGGTAAAMAASGDPRGWSQPPMPGFVHVLDPYHGVARGWDDAASVAALSRGGHRARGAAHDRRVHPRDGHRHQRHPGAARRLPAGRARAVRQARHPDDCRRSHVGLRPHRRVVRGRPLERRAGHDHDGQGADQLLRAARRGRRAPAPSPTTSRSGRFPAASPTAATRWPARRRWRRLPSTRRTA